MASLVLLPLLSIKTVQLYFYVFAIGHTAAGMELWSGVDLWQDWAT